MTHGARMQLLALLVLSIPATRADSDPVSDGLRRCAREGEETQRLACFDALVRSLPQIRSDQFGMSGAIERQRDPAAAAAAAEHRARESLAGTIAGLRQAPGGEWVFTLDNGQQWLETEPRPGRQFIVGEPVQIEHGALGALWLKADRHRQTRVKRIQ